MTLYLLSPTVGWEPCGISAEGKAISRKKFYQC